MNRFLTLASILTAFFSLAVAWMKGKKAGETEKDAKNAKKIAKDIATLNDIRSGKLPNKFRD